MNEGITVQDGKVGIGTITPTSDLELNGTLKLSDTIIGINNPVITNTRGFMQVKDNGLSFFPNKDLQLGQMDFSLGNGSKGLMRLEGRPIFLFAGDSLGMQFGTIPFSDPNNVWMEVGDKATFFRHNLGINAQDPVRPLHIFSTNKQVRLQSENTFTELNHFDGGTGQVAVLDINPAPATSDQAALVRLFRSTNTTGEANFQIFRGDNSVETQHILRGKGNSGMNLYDGNFGVGISAPTAKFEVRGSELGSTTGSSLLLGRFWGSNQNNDKMDFSMNRVSDGSNWISAALQIQRVVDQTPMGYMRFGHSVLGPVSFGVGSSEFIRMTGTGFLGVNSTSPARRLHVVEPTNAVVARFESSNALGARIRLHKSELSEEIGTEIIAGTNYTVFGWTGSGTSDYTAFQVGDEKMRIRNDGNVGIGTTSPTEKLEVAGFIKTEGTITPSDRNLKDNIQDYKKGLNELLALSPVSFQYNGKGGTVKGSEHLGLIAQEVEEILPELVQKYNYKPVSSDYGEEDREYLEIKTSDIPYLLINAIKDQQNIILDLRQENENLKRQLALQQNQFSEMQKDVAFLKSMIGDTTSEKSEDSTSSLKSK